MVNVLKKYNKKTHLIYISTDQVYNKNLNSKNSNEYEVNLTNAYSKAKFIAEKESLNYKYSTIIRTNFFGIGKYSKKVSFSDYIINLLNKNKTIDIPNNIIFSPIALNYLTVMIHKIIKKKVFGIFNIGSEEKINKYEFVLLINKLMNFNSKKIHGFESVYKIHRRPLNTSMNINKIKKIIQFKIPKIEKQLRVNYLDH